MIICIKRSYRAVGKRQNNNVIALCGQQFHMEKIKF